MNYDVKFKRSRGNIPVHKGLIVDTSKIIGDMIYQMNYTNFFDFYSLDNLIKGQPVKKS